MFREKQSPSANSVLEQTNGLRGPRWLEPASLARLLLCLVACQAVLQLNSGFWLDETLSYWATNAGLSQIVRRCTMWPSSILYGALFFALRPLGSLGPWIYRLPSFLAIALSVLVLFRMAKRLFGSETAWVAVAAFVSLHPVQFAACDARPYGLGLLAVLFSTDLLLQYLDRPSFGRAGRYAVVTALVPYFHLLFGVGLLFQLLYFVYCRINGLRVRLGHAAFALATIAVLALPLANQVLVSSKSAQIHSFAERPHANNFVEIYFTVDLALASLLAFGVAAFAAPKLEWSWASKGIPRFKVLAVLWALTGPLLLYLMSSFSQAQVFIPRYYLPYAAGLAICLAIAVGSFDRNIVATAFICGLVAMAALPLRHAASLRHTANLGNWGAAAAFVNEQAILNNTPILLRSQFAESNFLPVTPVEDNPSFSQLSYYPLKARVITLPATFSAPARQVIDAAVRTPLASSGRFLFVSYSGPPGSPQPFLFYIQGKLGSWQVRELGNFDGVIVTEFAVGGK